MAGWFGAIKAILPHIGTIVSAAAPVFTKRKPEAADQATLQQQISELQNAAGHNTALIKELAEQLRDALAVLQQAAAAREQELTRLRRISWTALGLSIAALVAAAVSVLLR